jgi:VWFA-related protein
MLLCGWLVAPPNRAQQPQQPEEQPTVRIGVTVENVVAPVLVFDKNGSYVNNIRPDQFHLYDNTKEQNISVDVVYQPISLVIAIQANSHVEQLLPHVQKIGNLIKPLLIGDQGEAAIIAYDARIRVLQDFTSDADKITQQVKKIYPGSTSNRLIDAVVEGTRMLGTRPKNRRRILVLIGETRDLGSESRSREALLGLQFANVLFYGVDMSRFMTTLTAPPPVPRPDNQLPAMHPLPSGVPATPTTVAQTYGLNGGRAEFIPMMVEVFKDVKAIFKDNPVEVFTKGTGGSEFGFHGQRSLEEAIQKAGEELHSQYTLSYSPNNKDEGGWHQITVEIGSHPEIKRIQTRPGYWLAPK